MCSLCNCTCLLPLSHTHLLTSACKGDHHLQVPQEENPVSCDGLFIVKTTLSCTDFKYAIYFLYYCPNKVRIHLGPSCVLTVVLLLRGLLHTSFKSFSLQKNPLLSEMLVTRLPVSCHLYHALLDLLFLQIKATKLCRKFPSCVQTIWTAKTHTAACSEEGSLLVTNPLLTHYKGSFLFWKVFPMDVTKDRGHFSTATELSKHQIAHPAQTSHLVHSLIFNSRGKDLTNCYCIFLSYGSLLHSSFFSALCFASFLNPSSAAE